MSDKLIKCIAHIRQNATGLVRHFPTEASDDLNPFLWEEGNFCCDCNRRLFFARVAGEKEDQEGACSDHEYSVNLQRMDTGAFYYTEFQP